MPKRVRTPTAIQKADEFQREYADMIKADERAQNLKGSSLGDPATYNLDDQEIVNQINARCEALYDAIDAAFAAGLRVELVVDALGTMDHYSDDRSQLEKKCKRHRAIVTRVYK